MSILSSFNIYVLRLYLSGIGVEIVAQILKIEDYFGPNDIIQNY